MISARRSATSKANPLLKDEAVQKGEGNRKWLARLGDEDGIILIGGAALADFRIRVAQSALRSDMLPSFWSTCGILLKGGVFASVSLDLRQDISAIPQSNGVRMCSLDDYDDPQRFPNVAVVKFAKAHKDVHEDIERVKTDRSIIDLLGIVLPWLGFVWGTSGSANPLSSGVGVPSAVFVETVFAMAGFELTPGLSSASSCPEAIWQSAKWWTDFYKDVPAAAKPGKSDDAVAMIPTGFFTIRQPAAAVVEISDKAREK